MRLGTRRSLGRKETPAPLVAPFGIPRAPFRALAALAFVKMPASAHCRFHLVQVILNGRLHDSTCVFLNGHNRSLALLTARLLLCLFSTQYSLPLDAQRQHSLSNSPE
ncbi:hypothetical protein CALVIDRAFT_115840 [Calocera viscosa TUFC12733]|uniref:Uncharacterized protein n=1 Tax=Calocera viscosa (strain TUFC12733) TaxID=1330018 RepID=A0A167M7L0_CALVF|nr:hypothetical protein CALVIDRAFT_115840 [Calocera viscosa TUFC12733]